MSRASLLIMAVLAAAAPLLTIAVHSPPLLIWNASASVPLGFYTVRRKTPLVVGDLVVVRPPMALARLLAQRNYVPLGVPLVKPIAALVGSVVCRRDAMITVDGIEIGRALFFDRQGRPLPVWRGCGRLGSDAVFLMNPARSDSFDGRYFGPTSTTDIVGRAIPLWTQRER